MTLIQELEKKISSMEQVKLYPKFEKQAAYLGNEVYSIPGTNLYSTDTRELFLMFCAAQLGIKFTSK